MQYVRKQEKVDAIQLVGKTTIEIEEGTGEMIEGEVGDWLVRTSDGENFILSDDEFNSKYEPVKQQKQQQGQRAVTPDALFNLYEENARAQNTTPVYPVNQQQYPQQAPYAAQGAIYPPQSLPPMIPIGQPQLQQQQPPQQEKRAQPPKKKGFGALFGGRKKKGSKNPEKDDFTSSNIQIV
jgi:hypothetical protein